MGDGGLVIHGPSNEASAVGSSSGGGKGAVEDTACDNDVVVLSAQPAHQSPMGTVALDAAVDGDRTAAALETQRTMRLRYDAGGKLGARSDGAGHGEVLDGSIQDVAERRGSGF